MTTPTDLVIYVCLDRAYSSLLAKGRLDDANELFEYLDSEMLEMDQDLIDQVVPYLIDVVSCVVGEA